MKNTVNKHHLWFTRNEYWRDPTYKRLREFAGFVIPTNIYDHRRLHENIWSGTPKPKLEVVRLLLTELPPRESMQSRDYQLNFAIGFLATHDEPLAAEHLADQAAYVMRTAINGE